nr:MAG TPA: hypothetical protein [Caudoviricetes sp.]
MGTDSTFAISIKRPSTIRDGRFLSSRFLSNGKSIRYS